MGVGLINYLSGKSYLNALFLSCNGPCLSCSHAGGASFSNKDVLIKRASAIEILRIKMMAGREHSNMDIFR